MYSFLAPILNRGGAGRSMTREESAEAITPLVTAHQRLLHAYDVAIRTLSDRDLAEQLNLGMNRARTELAKLRETVLSLGAVVPHGVDLDPNVRLGDSDAAIVHTLEDRERAYRDTLHQTLDLPHHQLRSTAILENNVKGSNSRLETLYPYVTRMRRPDATPASGPVAEPAPVPEDNTATPVDIAPDERHADPGNQPSIEPDRSER